MNPPARKQRTRWSRACAATVLTPVLVLASCNSRLLRPPVEILLDGRGERIVGRLGDAHSLYPAVYRAFVPERVSVHPGDIVDFDVRFTGEPHVVALGELVDETVAAMRELPPETREQRAPSLPQWRRLPVLLPRAELPGLPAPDQAAAMPCFLRTGSPPASERGGSPGCPQGRQPPFDGSHAFYSSGWLDDEDRFRLKIATDARAGEYAYICLVHQAQMVGTLRVLRPSELRPGAIDVKRATREEGVQLTTILRPAGDAALRARGLPILAGVSAPGAPGIVAGFAPSTLEVEPAAPVTWQVSGMHAIAFRPSRTARRGLVLRSKGTVTLNAEVWQGTNGRPSPAAQTLPAGSGEPVLVDGGSWDGTGTHASGLLIGNEHRPVSYRLRITTPGRFHYICLVHPVMRGTVDVTFA